jgi:hypothetical protein
MVTSPQVVPVAGFGIWITLIIVGAGMIWLMMRTIAGKEVDRRIIFLFIFVAVSAPVVFPIIFKERLSPTVKAVFEKVESLPPGSRVMIAFDFDPAMAPELIPMTNAFTRHCLSRDLRIIYITLWGTGQAMIQQTIAQVVKTEFPEKKEGVDYVNLGFKAGNEGVLNVIVTNLKKMYPTDVNSRPLDSIAMLDGIRSCKDVDLILATGGGQPGPKEWVLYVGDPGNVKIGAGLAAVSTPQLYPYFPKQLLGLVGGIKGAAEYEYELAKRYERFKNSPTPALLIMGPQTIAHVIIIAFIILGNVAFLRSRKKGGQK